MKSIYASKLYKASSRKDRIQAALLAPSNLSLVQQLADSLDEEYRTPENLGVEPSPAESEIGSDLFVDEEIDPEKDLMTVDDLGIGGSKPKSSGSKPKRSSPLKHSSGPSPKMPDLSDDAGPDNDIESVPDIPEVGDVKEEEPTEASTDITACQDIDLTVLKDSLNSRQDTCGVSRVVRRENEIWIYYKDDINLNNIMAEVIEYVMNAGYTSLEFNRLARSDNAIVFEVIDGTPLVESDDKD